MSVFLANGARRVSREIWLRTNRRAHWLLGLLPATMLVASATAIGLGSETWLVFGSWLLLFVSLLWLARQLWQGLQPRLAYSNGKLLVYLHGGEPIAVPIDIVECFFLGQGASLLPRALEGPRGEAGEAATIVVRLAEAAVEWSHREVLPTLGHWCEGYITIRGTWCEPINRELVAGLNQKLIAAHRSVRDAHEATVSG